MYIIILLKCTKCPKDSVKSLDVHQSASVHNAPVYSTNCIKLKCCQTGKVLLTSADRLAKENGEGLDESGIYEGNTVLYENEGKNYDVKIFLKTGMYKYYCTQ